MSPDPRSMTAQDFEQLYAEGGEDPWGFTSRWYEQRKRDITLAALPRRRFGSAFEPGCSIGVLTAALAERCEQLLAQDISEYAVARARARTADLAHVQVELGAVPGQWPAQPLDLVVLSEVGYYCGPADLVLLAERAAGSLTPDGVLVACHWRHPVVGYPHTGDDVHVALRARPELVLLVQHIEADFLLDVLVRRPATSVATAAGLVR